MAVTIAEYLGQRTDSQLPIQPVEILPEDQRNQSPLCPFDNQPCMKMRAKKNPKHPVCSVRKKNGQYYIVCENRLVSTNVGRITQHQKDMLLLAGRYLFSPLIEPSQLAYKAEVRIKTRDEVRGNHTADFVLAVVDPNLKVFGPRRILTEVQGGGETNNTGTISTHVDSWMQDADRTNTLLSRNLKPGPIETNAWRRLQEQLFAKATTAYKTGYGFAVLLGDVVFDYMWKMIPGLLDIRMKPDENWNVAFVVYQEQPLQEGEAIVGSIDLIVDSQKTFYTNLQKLFDQMALRGRSSPEAFVGDFITLDDEISKLE